MIPEEQIGEVNGLSITTVIDNYVDVFLPSTETVARWGPPDMTPGRTASHGRPAPLNAEHGLALLFEIDHGDRTQKILFDTGFTDEGVPRNLDSLGVNVNDIDCIVISHGHPDHTAALPQILRSAQKRIPVYTHMDAFLARYLLFPDGTRVLSNTLDQAAIREAGGDVVLTHEKVKLGPGVMLSGEIDMLNDFEQHFPLAYYEKDGEMIKDLFRDEKSLIVNLKNRGLVVVSGCGHRGIINTVEYAKRITGVDEVYAVMGGFHLTGATPLDRITRSVAEMKKIAPRIMIPTHCTGWKAINLFQESMPDSFVLNAVGTKYSLF
ncbi:MAG: MBL fold metallo-hydrolase [Deltaproteobacteria bacterium]|nr:MBL fold metallo-hydrolase [Deltaproteobacteria bacterium]